MLDIVIVANEKDLGLQDSTLPKAANVCFVQLADLTYAPTFGIDKRYFLTQNIQFQFANFRAHVIERLTQSGVNVTEVVTLLQALYGRLSFGIGNDSRNVKGLIK